MNIDELLKVTVSLKSSDLHLKVGSHPICRVHGHLTPMEQFPKITGENAVSMALSIMNPTQKQKFKDKFEVDLAYSAPGLGRFRVNVYQQRGSINMVFRVVPTQVASINELILPASIEKLANETRGLILVTGTTGSGKSTTLAAMIDYINRNRSENIITIEDPIEVLHRDRKSLVSQREIGTDAESFGTSLRGALRQDPDVILVGEMRDFETISTAMTAAETGHLVLSTLHTLDATETINRILSIFPPYQQKQLRLQLSSILKGIISQRLVPRADGQGRVPAVEIMMATQTIKECIIDSDKTRRIPEFIATGGVQYGMQTFDQSLYSLYQQKLITYEEALRWASNPDDFTLKVKGIQTTSDINWNDLQNKGNANPGGSGKSGSSPSKSPDIKIDQFGSS
ncbi:MAG: type IV pilus twitching motility protein PilT [Nitrospiria bacterium]